MTADATRDEPRHSPPAAAGRGRRFTVALTFPGEIRHAVEPIADALAETYGRERVFYDHYHRAELACPDLDVYLPQLYRKHADLIVVFLCPEYAAKRWCKLEWRSIRQLLAKASAERIMFVSFGDPGDLSDIGIFEGDGWVRIDDLSARQAAALIEARAEKLPCPAFSRRRRWPLVVAGAVAAVGLAWGLMASNVVCTTLSWFGICAGPCETTMSAEEIAGLHLGRLTFEVPPALAMPGTRIAEQNWLVENHSGRSVGLIYGPLLGSAGEKAAPRSWDLNRNLPRVPLELSTGQPPSGSTGAWVIAVFDPANPTQLLAATVVRLVFRSPEEQARLVPVGTGALTLEIKSTDGSCSLVQSPELPLVP